MRWGKPCRATLDISEKTVRAVAEKDKKAIIT
jgi:hypothetical protein